MKQCLGLLLFFASVAFAAQAWAAANDGCGDDKVKFDVVTRKGQPEPAPPAAGNAQVVFIEVADECGGCSLPPIRFGTDGQWSGANRGNSYFAVDVAPGIHHLCAAVQGSIGSSKQDPRWVDFAAAAGKVYYFLAKVSIVSRLTGVGIDANLEVNGTYNFVQVSEEEGKRRMNGSPRSVWRLKKY